MTAANHTSNTLPVFISLSEAARRTGLSTDALQSLIKDGKIKAAQTQSGEVLVNELTLDRAKTKEQLIQEKYPHLIGETITMTEAATKYKVPRGAIQAWVYRNGYIDVVDRDSYPMRINEAEVAYCAEVYHSREANGITRGVPLLDENGLPYDELKHPKLSEYRRRKKK